MFHPLRILMVGDTVGDHAVDFAAEAIRQLRSEHAVDFCIVNGENMHQGRGFNEVLCKRLFKAGADVLTGGDHSFDKHLIFPYMAKERRLLRPLNYPKGVPGQGYGIYELQDRPQKVGVLNLRGNTFFNNTINDPFRSADWAVEQIQRETPIIFVDFHAEATAEKAALAHYLDSRVSAIVGTHTHIPTADERVLPGGTGLLTDVGCTGVVDSVIGMHTKTAIDRFLLQIPQRYQLATGKMQLCGALVDIDPQTGNCKRIARVLLKEDELLTPVVYSAAKTAEETD